MNIAARVAVAIMIGVLFGSTSVAARTLHYSDHEPLGGMRTRFINGVFFAAIARESAGRLTIKAHWGGEIASGYEALNVVRKGRTADMAIVVPEYVEKALPLHQVFKSFPVGPSGGRQVTFFRRAYAEIPQLSAEIERQDVVNLFCATGYPVAFFAAKPLTDLGQVSGGRWRTASFWHRDFLRAAGAAPVVMPWGPGILDALKSRTLDGVMVNVDGGAQLNLESAAPNVVLSDRLWLGHLYLLVINKRTWDRLARRDRDAVQRAAQTAYAVLGAEMDRSLMAQSAELVQRGAAVRIPDANELARWTATSAYRKSQAKWVKRQLPETQSEARLVLEKVRALMSEFAS